MKKLLALFVFLFILFLVPITVSANSDITIKLDGELQIFDTKPILKNGRTLVPVRGIFEKLGGNVHWNDQTKEVLIEKGGTSLVLTINQKGYRKNDLESLTELDVPAQIINRRTYVPLRFISEELGIDVAWIDQSRTVLLCTITCERFIEEEQNQIQQERIRETQLSVKGLTLGNSLTKVNEILGKERERLMGRHGFEWLIFFEENYTNYLQVGIKNETVVAFYANSDIFQIKEKIKLFSTKNEVLIELKEDLISSIEKEKGIFSFNKSVERDLFALNTSYVTTFYDIHNENKVTSVKIIDKSIEQGFNAFYATGSVELARSYEKEMFHLTNSIRVRNGLSPLLWHEALAEVSRGHSLDMALNDYFSHDGLDGRDPFMRMTDAGIVYNLAGENLAARQFGPIYAVEGLMNSKGHRENLLNSGFKEIGIGVAFQEGEKPYFTQKFLTSSD